jgi:hypothetical protein
MPKGRGCGAEARRPAHPPRSASFARHHQVRLRCTRGREQQEGRGRGRHVVEGGRPLRPAQQLQRDLVPEMRHHRHARPVAAEGVPDALVLPDAGQCRARHGHVARPGMLQPHAGEGGEDLLQQPAQAPRRGLQRNGVQCRAAAQDDPLPIRGRAEVEVVAAVSTSIRPLGTSAPTRLEPSRSVAMRKLGIATTRCAKGRSAFGVYPFVAMTTSRASTRPRGVSTRKRRPSRRRRVAGVCPATCTPAARATAAGPGGTAPGAGRHASGRSRRHGRGRRRSRGAAPRGAPPRRAGRPRASAARPRAPACRNPPGSPRRGTARRGGSARRCPRARSGP